MTNKASLKPEDTSNWKRFKLTYKVDVGGLNEIEEKILDLRFAPKKKYKEIAHIMGISMNTLNYHTKNIRKKKGVKKVDELFSNMKVRFLDSEKKQSKK